jgi:tRNA dimethylallyltransferase
VTIRHTFGTVRDPRVRRSSLRWRRVVGRGAPQEVRRSAAEVVAIFGPTASGKTAVATRVAERLGTEVVSADALQVYRGLEILANQPTCPTRLVGIRDLDHEMSVGEYAALAHEAIDELVADRGTAVLAGGSGLYLRAALADLATPGRPAEGARARWEELYGRDPDEAMATLHRLDASAARRIHRNDRQRVVRALELAECGTSLVPEEDRLWSNDVRRPSLVAGLDVPPPVLEARIRERTAEMLERGVVDEARRAVAAGASRTASKALGLEELVTLSAQAAFERIVVRTRRYAAYQRKWMRRIPGIVLLDGARPVEEIAHDVLDLARTR